MTSAGGGERGAMQRGHAREHCKPQRAAEQECGVDDLDAGGAVSCGRSASPAWGGSCHQYNANTSMPSGTFTRKIQSDEAIHPHRLGAIGRLGEQIHDERERHRIDHCAAEALNAASPHQERARSGQAAGE
ncbi:MAG TPA: hypothetical protein VN735_14555 [Steroidobacteraceae bacterium]|nr:hypothetical protein [Steroidobacteraceae bacterium]